MNFFFDVLNDHTFDESLIHNIGIVSYKYVCCVVEISRNQRDQKAFPTGLISNYETSREKYQDNVQQLQVTRQTLLFIIIRNMTGFLGIFSEFLTIFVPKSIIIYYYYYYNCHYYEINCTPCFYLYVSYKIQYDSNTGTSEFDKLHRMIQIIFFYLLCAKRCLSFFFFLQTIFVTTFLYFFIFHFFDFTSSNRFLEIRSLMFQVSQLNCVAKIKNELIQEYLKYLLIDVFN